MTATILSSNQLDQAIAALCGGDIVGMPTETVYGLAGDASNVHAVTKIFAAKERPHFDPLIVHIPTSWNTLEQLSHNGLVDIERCNDSIRKSFTALAKKYWPGPLTIIVPKHAKVPDLVTSGLDRVGLRMPAHPVAQALLQKSGLALAAPSANRFGRISPTCAQDVFEELGDRLSWIVDGGPCTVGVESTVVMLGEANVQLLRPGKITLQELSDTLSPYNIPVAASSSHLDQIKGTAQSSPGMLASHYAPRKPLYLIAPEELASLATKISNGTTVSILMLSDSDCRFSDIIKNYGFRVIASKALSASGDPSEVARNLFASMRQLDDSTADIILAEAPLSGVGLWHAIHDRLTRASTRTPPHMEPL